MPPPEKKAIAAINFAYDLERRGRFTDAIDALRSAYQRFPHEAAIAWRLGMMLMREGQNAEGWPLYERRPIEMGGRPTGKPQLSFPEWTGEPIQSLLILPEQGLGDQIMFARYAPYLRDRGVKVAVMCHPALARLFGRLDVPVLPAEGRVSLPRCDAWALGPSLPYRVGVVPSRPYLRASGGAGGGIGLLAQGNPDNPTDKLRSLPDDLARELLALPGVRTLERSAIGAADLEDTARAIEPLDLVISVDTAVAHLAAAMGKPCWVLLPHVADWRWGRDRQDSTWYETARLFRQSSPGDWAGVIDRVKVALDAVRSGRQALGTAG